MDKETNNILELKAYMETNPTLEHRSGAVDFFCADVEYKDSTLGDYTLQNVEIRFPTDEIVYLTEAWLQS